MQESTLVLFGAALLLMEMAAVRLMRDRTLERRAAAVRTASLSLFLARRLHSMATRSSATGSENAGLMLCLMARRPLKEGSDALARVGDDCQSILMDLERGRNAELHHLCARGLRYWQGVLSSRNTCLWRSLQAARLNLWLEEAEGLFSQAAGQFDARRYLAARETYCSARTKYMNAFRVATLFGRVEFLPAIREGLEACRRARSACNEWIVDDGFAPEVPRRLYVKGRISPYFRREDGTSAPRPERPGFWGATGHVLYP